MDTTDTLWFQRHPRRHAHIRRPLGAEFAADWRLLGEHRPARRYVLVWRIPADNPGRAMIPDGILRVPFLASGDESIADKDSVLLPILAGIMRNAEGQSPGQTAPRSAPGQFPGW